MRRSSLFGLLASVLSIGAFSPAHAADHSDGPAVIKAAPADITDLYAWESSDGSQTYFIVNSQPGAAKTATFSPEVQLALHITAMDKYGQTDASQLTRSTIICQFAVDQTIACWLGAGSTTGISTATDYVHGDASATSGLTSVNGKLQVFAGPRNDPFFFNLDGFNAATTLVKQAFPGAGVRIDASACPTLPAGTSSTVAAQLAGSPPATGSSTPGAPVDAYAKKNVMALVLAVKTAALTDSTHPILSVWASTHVKP